MTLGGKTLTRSVRGGEVETAEAWVGTEQGRWALVEAWTAVTLEVRGPHPGGTRGRGRRPGRA